MEIMGSFNSSSPMHYIEHPMAVTMPELSESTERFEGLFDTANKVIIRTHGYGSVGEITVNLEGLNDDQSRAMVIHWWATMLIDETTKQVLSSDRYLISRPVVNDTMQEAMRFYMVVQLDSGRV